MQGKVVCKDFTQPEIDFLINMCNFSDIEKEIFIKRCKNISIDEISIDMCMSVATVNRSIRHIKNKIYKVL